MAVERWLVTHKESGGVLSVVWEAKWFAARARAEQVWRDDFRRDQLLVEPCPLLPEEEGGVIPCSATRLASLLGKKMHPLGEKMHPANFFRQCGAVWLFKNGTCVFCVLERGHAGQHSGRRKRWSSKR
jgi:hypothetical protein